MDRYKREIDAFLASFLASKEKDFANINPWGPDILKKIQGVISEGKTIRGCLVLYTHDALKGKNRDTALRVGAAYELMQTALVIRDDIMDHDTVRRGKPAMHVQYHSEALAMCAGDILFFLAHELLANSGVEKMSAQIFQEVGLAQMQDVAKTAQSKEDIIALYKYKTARYTFSLPLMAGAMLAKANKKTITLLEQFGEAAGILFQIQNDTKNVAGDRREGKKTLAPAYANTFRNLAKDYVKQLDTIIDTTMLRKFL